MQLPPRLVQTLLAAPLLLAVFANTASADIVIVNQFGFTFSPQHVTINVGDTVRWVHHDGNHDTTEGDDGTVDGNEAWYGVLHTSATTYDVLFDAAFLATHPRPNDHYKYFCSPHWNFGMKGTVTVTDPEPGTSFCDCSSMSSCNNGGSADEGCLNSTGSGAVLTATGSTSAGTDDIAFHGDLMPSNKPALLFFGVNSLNGGAGATFGDGVRCAGGALVRLSVQFTDVTGATSWPAGQNASGLWSAGDTRYFQIWYRDPQNGPCGTAFNVSNGYAVTFN